MSTNNEIEEILIPAAVAGWPAPGPRFDGLPPAALREACLALQACLDGAEYNVKEMLRGAAVELRPLILAGRDDALIEEACLDYVDGVRPKLTAFEEETVARVEAEIRLIQDQSLAVGHGLLTHEPEASLRIYPLKGLVATDEESQKQAYQDLVESGIDSRIAHVVESLSELVRDRLVNTLRDAMFDCRPLMLSGRPLSEIMDGFSAYAEAYDVKSDVRPDVEELIEPFSEREHGMVDFLESVIAHRCAFFMFHNAAGYLDVPIPDTETIDLDRLRNAVKALA